ncbi:hypothetical protein KUTeg_017535 [Tegillarca granosa]|uniref:Ig-like domain-containing protein n=1 Tax=Tegillarca granosa TaxID=220873 RepID=A0ABQ9EF75_TEGGR|nr:hypothetical protein KUTeg_017535 [Tegillarca granosa]
MSQFLQKVNGHMNDSSLPREDTLYSTASRRSIVALNKDLVNGHIDTSDYPVDILSVSLFSIPLSIVYVSTLWHFGGKYPMDYIEDMESLSVIFRYSVFRLGILIIILFAKASCGGGKRQPEPRFLDSKTNLTKYRDETAVLECLIEHLGPKTVAWRKVSEDFPLSVGDMMYAPNDDMSIKVRKRSRDINKKVTYEPVINLTGTEYVDKDQKINLTCNATGADRAPSDIDWFHEGNRIYTNNKKWRNRIEITKYKPEIPGRSLISSLIIERSTLNDTDCC